METAAKHQAYEVTLLGLICGVQGDTRYGKCRPDAGKPSFYRTPCSSPLLFVNFSILHATSPISFARIRSASCLGRGQAFLLPHSSALAGQTGCQPI